MIERISRQSIVDIIGLVAFESSDVFFLFSNFVLVILMHLDSKDLVLDPLNSTALPTQIPRGKIKIEKKMPLDSDVT